MTSRSLFAYVSASVIAMIFSVLLLVLSSHSARASLVLSSGQTAIYNFDFTGQSPSPPYFQMTVQIDYCCATGGAMGSADVYSGLNASGVILNLFTGPVPTTSQSFNTSNLSFTDGLFSVLVAATAGSFGSSATAFASDANGKLLASVSGQLATTPLPATLPLFASGLGVMGLLGWRRKKKAQATA
jgi:hypothetical protein